MTQIATSGTSGALRQYPYVVSVRPSATLTAQRAWPNYYAWGCTSSIDDEVYFVSSAEYNHLQCSQTGKHIEVVRLNASHMLAGSRRGRDNNDTIQAWLYPEEDCSGPPVSMESFYPTCRYNLVFPNGVYVRQNVRSIQVRQGGRRVRLFQSCYTNVAAMHEVVSSATQDTCYTLSSVQRHNVQLFVGDPPRDVLGRVTIGSPHFHDHFLEHAAVGQTIADTVISCAATDATLHVLVSNYKKCSGVDSGILVLNRDLSWSAFWALDGCSFPRDSVQINRTTIVVACTDTSSSSSSSSSPSQLRVLNLLTGRVSVSLTLSMEYTYEFSETKIDVILNPLFTHFDPQRGTLLTVATRWNDVVVAKTPIQSIDNLNATEMTLLDTLDIPTSVSYDAFEQILYTVNAHRVVSVDTQTMQVNLRDEMCGTTILELADMGVSSIQAASDTGYLYALADLYSESHAQTVVHIRTKGIEQESLRTLAVSPDVGYVFNLYPMWDMKTREHQNYTLLRNVNISTLTNNGLHVLGSRMYGATPPLIAVLPASGCVRGRAGAGQCYACDPGYHAPRVGMHFCEVCLEGMFTAANESHVCQHCPAGYHTRQNRSLSCDACPVGRYADTPGSPACTVCPSDHAHMRIGSTRSSDCLPCASGYVAGPGSPACEECPPGRRKTGVNTCTLCATGFFGGGGEQVCEACTVGKYGVTNGSAVEALGCAFCPPGKAGFYTGLSHVDKCLDCALGMYKTSADDLECSVCEIGKITNVHGGDSCTPCPAGTRTLGDERQLCYLCPSGQFGSELHAHGDAACVSCPRNTFSVTVGASNDSLCLSCAPGRHTVVDGASTRAQCVVCGRGSHREEFEIECEQCPVGWIAKHAAAALCAICPAGKYEVQRTSCQSCPVGSYKDTSGPGDCLECAAGSVSHTRGANASESCEACPVGWYSESTTDCAPCPAGTYSALSGQTSPDVCMPCPAGTYGPTQAAFSETNCTMCAPGKYGIDKGAVDAQVCEDCPVGTFRESPGAGADTECVPCTAGRASVGSGSATCAACRAGMFSSSGASSCSECPPGRFAANDESLSCEICGEGSEPTDSKDKCVCSVGMYTLNRSRLNPTCEPCPSRVICTDTDQLLQEWQLKPGFWRHSTDTLEIRRCPEYHACLGGQFVNTTDSMCRQGHRGPLCEVCQDGWAKTSDQLCAVCPPEDKGMNLAVTILAPVVLLCIVTMMIVTANPDHENADLDDNLLSGVLKITSSLLQIYTVCSSFDVRWPATLIEIFQKSDALNPSLGFFSAQCSFQWTFFDRGYTYMAMPPVYVALSLCAVGLLGCCLKEKGEPRRVFIQEWGQTSTVVGLFLMYPSVVKALFRGLACTTVGDHAYLTKDFSIRCFEGEHAVFVVPAVCCLVLYGVGIPAVAMSLMWQWRFTLHDKGARPLQFLHRGYRHERFYWEIVVLIRKVVVIAMSVFLFKDENASRYQSPVASWFFVTCLLLHLTCEPFDHLTSYGRVCNLLEASGISACICTLNAALVFGTHVQNYDQGWFEYMVLILTLIVNGAVGSIFAYWLVVSGLSKSRHTFRKALHACCYSHDDDNNDNNDGIAEGVVDEEDPLPPRLPLRRRRSSIHEWVIADAIPSSERQKELELTKRAPETVELDNHLRSTRSQKLKSLHAKMESGQRRRMYYLDEDLKAMQEVIRESKTDGATHRVFQTDWKRHMQELSDKMKTVLCEEETLDNSSEDDTCRAQVQSSDGDRSLLFCCHEEEVLDNNDDNNNNSNNNNNNTDLDPSMQVIL